MVNYYPIYRDIVKILSFGNIDTGIALLQHIIQTPYGNELRNTYEPWEVKEIIFYTLDSLIDQGFVSATEMPLSDSRIYIIDGLTSNGMRILEVLSSNNIDDKIMEWHKEFRIPYPNPTSIKNALVHIMFG